MSDLISRSALIDICNTRIEENEILGNYNRASEIKILKEKIINLPTAYNTDKVVEQLEDYKEEYSSGNGEFTDELVDRVLRNAIETVKVGGIDYDGTDCPYIKPYGKRRYEKE